MADTADSFDLIVIGAGPGGYVAAIRAAQLGMRVACVEKQYLGGTCLNVGCIPSKALLDSSERYATAKHGLAERGIGIGEVSLDLGAMMNFKQKVVNQLTGGVGFLFKKNKVTHLEGHGRIAGPGKVSVDGDKVYAAKNILIATGSKPIQIGGFDFDGTHILSSTEALDMETLPGKLLIVGGGYIGVEIGSVWNRLGSEVTVLEFMDRILPASDRESAAALQKLLTKQGITFHFETKAEKAEVVGDKVRVTYSPKAGGDARTVEVDRVMVAVGRAPVTDDVGLDTVGVTPDKRGFIEVDEHYKAAEGVYAIGDAIGRIMLAHNAEEEGVAAVETMAGQHGHVAYEKCPAVVYTHPELASVGLTEEQAKEKHAGDVKIGKFPLTANGRARGMGETEGFVKVIGRKSDDRLIGVHILAAHASDMIAECVVAMEFAASVEDLARSFHAHPTLPEAIKEAALATDGAAIHA